MSNLIEGEKENFTKDILKFSSVINNVKGNIVTKLLEFRFRLMALNNISDAIIAF